jgi:hypothetical protein
MLVRLLLVVIVGGLAASLTGWGPPRGQSTGRGVPRPRGAAVAPNLSLQGKGGLKFDL